MRSTPIAAALALLGSTLAYPFPLGTQLETNILQVRQEDNSTSQSIKPSFDIKSCPGYRLTGQPQVSDAGFTAQLSLGGEACNAYGVDIQNLTLAVVYEKKHQLHVHIYDTDKQQYQLPSGLIFDRPGDDPASVEGGSTADESDFVFHHTAEGSDAASDQPWSFWVERKSTGDVIFDTRAENIPTYTKGINNVSGETKRNSTAMPAHPLVFENQYLQISSALPEDANIYGLGEYVSGSFRRDPNETLQPFFTLDAGTPVDSNQYGYHPIYTEARRSKDGKLRTHAVYMQNTAGMDVLLRRGLIQYRAIGGTLDLRFFSGDEQETNSANTAISQYVNFIGLPSLHPYWSYGFHLCRWGYNNVSDTKAIVDAMREADIPLEVQWNDIDYMQEFRDFTTDPKRFEQKEFADFVRSLNESHQHYIPIVDAAIPKAPTNASDSYFPGSRGEDLDVFMKNRNGTQYIGEVWPGYTNFVDEQAENAGTWWNEVIANFSDIVPFSGLWLDMDEPSSFVPGNAAGPNTNLSDTPSYQAATSQAGWPQGYDNQTSGNSGNITVDGRYTFQAGVIQNNDKSSSSKQKRAEPTTDEERFGPSNPDYEYRNSSQRFLSNPPYAIHNGIHISETTLNINLDKKTVAMDAVGTQGLAFYDVHNLDGTLLEQHVFRALQKKRPNERPFLISRSTYPGAGQFTGHWLGDNFALWTILPGKEAYKAGAGMAQSIDGMLQFQMFGMPMVGADVCGFNRNSDEELCNRWMMLGAFSPFFRNHNTQGAIAQEPFRWDSVAKASRIAIRKRLEILPTLYSHMSKASLTGEPAIRAIWYEFPDEFERTKDFAHQFLFGPDLLVTPVLEPNVTSVKGLFPAAGGKWRNIFSHEALDVEPSRNVSVPAPLSSINVHQRPGSVLLTHAETRYTTYETRQQPFGMVVNLNDEQSAKSSFYMDDGVSPAPTANSTLTVTAANGSLSTEKTGDFAVEQKLDRVLILDVQQRPQSVRIGDRTLDSFEYNEGNKILNLTRLDADLNQSFRIEWS